MVDTAIAKSHDPVRMAGATKAAVEGGRLARLAGRIPKRNGRTVEPAAGPRRHLGAWPQRRRKRRPEMLKKEL